MKTRLACIGLIILIITAGCSEKDPPEIIDPLCAEILEWDADGVVYKIVHNIDTVRKDQYIWPVKHLYLARFHMYPGVFHSGILFNNPDISVSLKFREYVYWKYKFANYPLRFQYFIDHPEVSSAVIFNETTSFNLSDTIVVLLKDFAK